VKKRRILFDATPLIDTHVSGVGKVLKETLKVLDSPEYAQKYRISLFVPLDEYKKAKALGYKTIGIKWLPYPHKFVSLFSRFSVGPPIDLFLGKGTYVFSNFRNWTLLFSRSITYIHDVTFKLFPDFVQARNLAYLQKYIPVWLKRADTVVTISQTSRDEIESELGIKDVVVVPNAVDGTEFKPQDVAAINAMRDKWGLPQNYFVFIGNIEPRKNLSNMIKGFRKYIVESGSDDALVIIGGGGWKNESILAEINQACDTGVTIIRPNGYVPDEDLPAIISGAKALVQPSWHEGFGLPVLQALACGTPCVASDIPALHEAAFGNDDSVIYVKPNDVDEIAQALDEVGRIAHVTSPKNIPSWNDSVKRLIEIIERN